MAPKKGKQGKQGPGNGPEGSSPDGLTTSTEELQRKVDELSDQLRDVKKSLKDLPKGRRDDSPDSAETEAPKSLDVPKATKPRKSPSKQSEASSKASTESTSGSQSSRSKSPKQSPKRSKTPSEKGSKESVTGASRPSTPKRSLSASKKHQEFMTEPFGEKGVTKIPGIGETYGDRLKDRGYKKAYHVLGKFLLLGKSKVAFIDWLVNTCLVGEENALVVYECLAQWCSQHM